jgi:putative ABC transport system substrate-binding protein
LDLRLFAILDFGLRGEDMTKMFRTIFRSIQSDNRKSKTCTELSRSIQNLKRLGPWLIAFSLTAGGVVAQAQQATKIHRIGLLSAGPAHDLSYASRHDAFRQGLRQLGYVEGKNLTIEERFADGKLDRQPPLAAELIRSKVDVIVVGGATGVRAVRRHTSTIPTVMAFVSDDPVQAGFVDSLARPGGNITGLTSISTELSGKRLELIKEAIPKLARVAFLRDPTNPATAPAETEVAAKLLKVDLQLLEARSSVDFENAFRSAVKGRADAVIIQSGGLFTTHEMQIINLAAKNRLPAMYTEQNYVSAGGLMAYATSIDDLYRRAATYVDKILKGSSPADLPVERPMKFELVINLKAAKQIGLMIPANLLARADTVIR